MLRLLSNLYIYLRIISIVKVLVEIDIVDYTKA
jgi:hypothetical protein